MLTSRRSIYFVVIGTSWAQGWVKKVQRRLDFSIDIFSPSLNLDKHINRRVWQETLATMRVRTVPCGGSCG